MIRKKSEIPFIEVALSWDGSVNKPTFVNYCKRVTLSALVGQPKDILSGCLNVTAAEESYNDFFCWVTKDVDDPDFVPQVEQLLCSLPNVAVLVSRNVTNDKKNEFVKQIVKDEWPRSFCSDQKTIQECLYKM